MCSRVMILIINSYSTGCDLPIYVKMTINLFFCCLGELVFLKNNSFINVNKNSISDSFGDNTVGISRIYSL